MKHATLACLLLLSVATLPAQRLLFEENFETDVLDDRFWTARADLSGTGGVVEIVTGLGVDRSRAVFLGKSADGGFVTNALDLRLDLSGAQRVRLDFLIADIDDEDNREDGLLFSDDGGENFVQVIDFSPSLWTQSRLNRYPPIPIDELAAAAGLSLTEQFVVRFQQRGENDRSGSASDGLYVDEVRVVADAYEYASLPFEDNFESGQWKPAWEWSFAEGTDSLAGLSPTTTVANLVEVQQRVGLDGSRGVRLTRAFDGAFTTNAFDLHLDLEGERDVALGLYVRSYDDETDRNDGIYLSDDGGRGFVKVLDFDPDFWCGTSVIGRYPDIDIDGLAEAAGLDLTSTFVIRIQQRGEADVSGSNSDGIAIDEVRVFDPGREYVTLPFTEDFETDVLEPMWNWAFAQSTASISTEGPVTTPANENSLLARGGADRTIGLFLGRQCDGAATVNAFDLYLDLAGATDVELTFAMRDYGNASSADDGLYASVDDGAAFVKLFDFDHEAVDDNVYAFYDYDVSDALATAGLIPSATTVLRWQQRGTDDASGSSAAGIVIDDVAVKGAVSSVADVAAEIALRLAPNPVAGRLSLAWATEKEVVRLDVRSLTGQLMSRVRVAGGGSLDYDASSLPPGVYLAQVYLADGRRAARRFVKQ